uniref:Putative ABC transport system permease protein n=1 Tax=Tetraselmis sp. GSL018 TaxID=582737 RepID=A0A061RZR3_9CHLO
MTSTSLSQWKQSCVTRSSCGKQPSPPGFLSLKTSPRRSRMFSLRPIEGPYLQHSRVSEQLTSSRAWRSRRYLDSEHCSRFEVASNGDTVGGWCSGGPELSAVPTRLVVASSGFNSSIQDGTGPSNSGLYSEFKDWLVRGPVGSTVSKWSPPPWARKAAEPLAPAGRTALRVTDALAERLFNGPIAVAAALFTRWNPPKWFLRSMSAVILAGQVTLRIAQGKIHWRNTIEQLRIVGPNSLGVCLLTASFVGMVFTIQFAREFTKLGLTRSIGGVLALALARELVPVITSVILAGRVGSAFAAELGTMQVSQQTDTLRVLQTDPVDYLVTPRVLACLFALPVLVILCFGIGMGASVFLAEGAYQVSANIMLDSAQASLTAWDIISSLLKSVVFGYIISVVSCSWGYTTTGGAKGVGESTTSAVVISLVGIFIADFVLSYLFFHGQGDALKQLM